MTGHVVTDVQPARLMLHKRSGGRSGKSVESTSVNRLTVTHGYMVLSLLLKPQGYGLMASWFDGSMAKC